MRSGREAEPDPIFHQLFFLFESDPLLSVELLVVSIRPSGGFGDNVVVDGLDNTCKSLRPLCDRTGSGIVIGEVSNTSPPG